MASNSLSGARWKERVSLAEADPDSLSNIERPDHLEESQVALTKDDVYRRLYGILSLMTIVLFAINVLQVCLLRQLSNLYWIVLFPLLVFVAFISWAGIEITTHPTAFRTKDANAREGAANIGLHLLGLFSPDGKGPQRPTIEERKNWPIRFNRASVVLTILLNVILVEFIYLPVIAVPAFKEKKWNVSLKTASPPRTPAVAVIQPLNVAIDQWAHLPIDSQVWSDLCQWLPTAYPSGTERCIASGVSKFIEHNSTGALGEEVAIRYAIFDPAVVPTLPLYEPLDLWYPYKYDGIGTIITTLAFFDPKFIPDFTLAYQCGALTRVQLGTQSWYQIQLRQFSINDHLNAMNREEVCKVDILEEYMGYETEITQLGPQTTQGHFDCNIASPAYNGTCNGVTQVEFGSVLTTTYQSKHGKDWIEILTEEGGIVGFVTFLTWFLGIFKM